MSESATTPRINPWSIWLIILVMVGGLFIYYKYLQELKRQEGDDRPPLHARLETNLEAVEQSGEAVSLAELKGKVYLCNYIFTRCPGQCIGVAEVMKTHFQKYQGHRLFHLVSVSLDPANDTPEDLRAFTKKHGLESDQWWFLTGDESTIRNYMARYFRFRVRDKPLKARAGENDLFDHDALIALVNHKGHIRGLYSVFDQNQGEELRERLVEDLKIVMEEAANDIPLDSLPEPTGNPQK